MAILVWAPWWAVEPALAESFYAFATVDDQASDTGRMWAADPPADTVIDIDDSTVALTDHTWVSNCTDSATVTIHAHEPMSCPCSTCRDGTSICRRSPHCNHERQSDLVDWLQQKHQRSQACWTGRVDAVLMWRNAPYSRELASNASSGLPALNANALESTLAAGPRFQIFRTTPCGSAIEVGYLRTFNFRSQRVLDGTAFSPSNIFPTANPSPLPFADASVNLGSGIQTLEVNGRVPMGIGAIQFIAGVRWLEWRESFSMNTSTPPGTFDNYTTNVMNSLYGGQLGIDALLYTTGWLRVESVLKGGGYYNTAASNSSYLSGGLFPSPNRTWAAYGIPSSGAFVGELGFTGVIPLSRRLDFRFGYLGLWLQSIAQPTRQLSNPAAVVSNGATIVQGVTFGLEGRW